MKKELTIWDRFYHQWTNGSLDCKNEGSLSFLQVETYLKSELSKEIEKIKVEKSHTYASENADIYRAYDAGQEAMKKRIISKIIPQKI